MLNGGQSIHRRRRRPGTSRIYDCVYLVMMMMMRRRRRRRRTCVPLPPPPHRNSSIRKYTYYIRWSYTI